MKTESPHRNGPRYPRPRKTAATGGAADSRSGLRPHDLVFLHGQPGTAADWQLISARLPAQLRAIAPDRPGYGSSPQPPGGFAANARTVVHQLDARGIRRAVLVGHSYGGGVALAAAALAPQRIEAVVLLASVGPGCVSAWDKLLAAPAAGPVSALVAWRLTPWIARARLAWIARLRDRPLTPGEHVNWQVWAQTSQRQGLWRTFLAEQRALVRELDGLAALIPSVPAPALLLADPKDRVVPLRTARRLVQALPNSSLQLIEGVGHHLPRRAPGTVADAIAAFLGGIDSGGDPD